MPPRRPTSRDFRNRWQRIQESVPVPPIPSARMTVPPNEFPWEVVSDEARILDFETNIPREFIEQMRNTPFREPLVECTNNEEALTVVNAFRAWQAQQRRDRTVTVEFDDNHPRIQARATERPRGYWKLRNGKLIAMSEMDDDHLENCIRLCERNAQTRGRRANYNAPGPYSELITERNNRRRRLEEHAQQVRALLEYQNSTRRQQDLLRQRPSQAPIEVGGLLGFMQTGVTPTPDNPSFTGEVVEPVNQPQVTEIQEPESLMPAADAPKRRIKT